MLPESLDRRITAGGSDPSLDLSRVTLPPRSRADARLTVMDVTKWFGEASGGVRTYLLRKAAYVERRQDVRQVIVLPGSQDCIIEGDGVRIYRLRGPRIPTQRTYRFLLATRSLRRIIEHERPDVIEVGSPFLVPWVTRHATRGRSVPLLNYYHFNFPDTVGRAVGVTTPVGRAATGICRWYVRQLDSLFATTFAASDFAEDALRDAGVGKVTRTSLGVDLDTFHPERRRAATRVRSSLGLGPGPLVGFVGRLAPEKRLDVLVSGWQRAAAATGGTLLMIGDGPVRSRLGGQGGASVKWVPFIEDRERLADITAALDVAVAPGPSETFGLAALEALASGTPLLAPDQGGAAELVRRSGAGAQFTDGNPASLATALDTLLASDRTALSARARSYAERFHAWDHIFDAQFDAYARHVAE